jgi:hypothetical protein
MLKPDDFDPINAPPPDLWPAYLWIVLGAMIYAAAPELYDPFAAAAYFLFGGALALAVLGTVTARFEKLMGPILRDLIPAADNNTTPLLTTALRWLVLGMEGLAVMHLARITVVGLAAL